MISSSFVDHNDFGSPIVGTNESSSRTDQSSDISFLQTPSTTPSSSKAQSRLNNPSIRDLVTTIDLTTPNFNNYNSPAKNMSTFIDLCSPLIATDNLIPSSFTKLQNRKILMSSPSDCTLSDESSRNERLFLNDSSTQNDKSNSVVIHGIDDKTDDEENRDEEEDEDHRRQKEAEAESEELARQLMAEEAMASYAMSTNFLRDHANDYTEEDLAALQAIMNEENPETMENTENEEDYVEEAASEDLSYDTLLRLGERMGDVKSERWALIASEMIDKLPKKIFTKAMSAGKDENDCGVKCLVCQCAFEEAETIRILPCQHYFHEGCIDQWLLTKDNCPYCRVSIVNENNEIRK